MELDGHPLALDAESDTDLIVACRHLEDLEIFVGQRSRMHPGPGWALVLSVLRQQLEVLRSEMRRRGA